MDKTNRGVVRGLPVLAALLLLLSGMASATAGRLAAGDEQLQSGEYFDRMSFGGTAGEQVRLELHSDEFDPYLLLLDAAGTVVLEVDDSAGAGTGVDELFTFPAGGTFTAVITSLMPGETGAYRFALSAAASAPAVPRARPAAPAPAGVTAQPGTVTGTVTDAQGRPLPGIEVTLRPSLTVGEVKVFTDQNGVYVADGLIDVPYVIRAWQRVDYNGSRVCVRLGLEQPGDYSSFSVAQGAVRNFSLQHTGQIYDMLDAQDGQFGGAIMFTLMDDLQGPLQLEFNFSPTGPLFDGSQSTALVRQVTTDELGRVLVRGIPVGPYQVSVTLLGQDGSRQPVNLSGSWGGPDMGTAMNVNWIGDGSCNLGSGFEWFDLYGSL